MFFERAETHVICWSEINLNCVLWKSLRTKWQKEYTLNKILHLLEYLINNKLIYH
jgi:hypothetical protein